jgi:hypothetical protein
LRRNRAPLAATALLLLSPLRAQGVLDVLDGETLYDGGSLLTFGYEFERGDSMRSGRHRVFDPFAAHESTWRTTMAFQYGLRNTLQLGVALPYVAHERASTAGDVDTDGIGDLQLLAKWRVYRWDAPAQALNLAVLGELSLPTGDDDAQQNGVRLEPELQTGSGGIDPALGFGLTHEPGRWRFNMAALYRWRTDTDGDHAHLGDELVVELAAGNRFWLEPYPGPFMRFDLLTRYYQEQTATLQGPLPDSGSERATIGFTLAFRPRPELDFQLGGEVPYWQDVHGTQLGEDWSVHFDIGYRF